MLKNYEEAIRSCEKYIYYADHYDQYLGQDIRMVSCTLSGREEAHLDLSVLYKETGRNIEAAGELMKIESPEILNMAAAHGAALLADMQEFGMLEGFYRKIQALADEDMTNHFYQVLERYLLGTEGEWRAIYRIFEHDDTEYGILNRIRLLEHPENAGPGLLEELGKLQLGELDDYYGDIFYFIIKGKLSLSLIDRRITEERLNWFFQYIDAKYSDLSELYCDYLQNCQTDCALDEIRIRKIMRRTVLLADSIEDSIYEHVLDGYLEEGISCVRQIYNADILTAGNAHLLKNKEEAFFLYMNLARQVESSDQAAYVRNLKSALQSYPEMKKGVEILLKRVTDKIDANKNAAGGEMEAYAQVVKENIKRLVDQNRLREANALILGYEEIIPDDPDIAQIKARMEVSGIKIL